MRAEGHQDARIRPRSIRQYSSTGWDVARVLEWLHRDLELSSPFWHQFGHHLSIGTAHRAEARTPVRRAAVRGGPFRATLRLIHSTPIGASPNLSGVSIELELLARVSFRGREI